MYTLLYSRSSIYVIFFNDALLYLQQLVNMNVINKYKILHINTHNRTLFYVHVVCYCTVVATESFLDRTTAAAPNLESGRAGPVSHLCWAES